MVRGINVEVLKDLTSSRKKGAHLFVKKCAPLRKEEHT